MITEAHEPSHIHVGLLPDLKEDKLMYSPHKASDLLMQFTSGNHQQGISSLSEKQRSSASSETAAWLVAYGSL